MYSAQGVINTIMSRHLSEQVYAEYTHGKSFDLWVNWEIDIYDTHTYGFCYHVFRCMDV